MLCIFLPYKLILRKKSPNLGKELTMSTRRILSMLTAVMLLAIFVAPVFAQPISPKPLWIDPYHPMEAGGEAVTSPATFEIWAGETANPAHDINVFLVMTEASYNGLSGDVVVSWSGGAIAFEAADFTAITLNSLVVPGTIWYTVASLKDHLSYGLSEEIGADETIYWAMGPILGGAELTDVHQEITVTLPSSSPRMLVYIIGKSEGSTEFDCFVPPTPAGFIVPEIATIFTAGASLAAFGAYAYKRKKQ
jgi:hypothetical protein